MRTLSLVFGGLAALGMLLAFLPALGWLNWILVLPPALFGLLLAAISKDRTASLFCGMVILLAMLRLLLGWGIL